MQDVWSDELDCAVTVCDTDGVVIYQNGPFARGERRDAGQVADSVS